MITTVFIDIDNTLLDFDVCATYAMSKGLEKYGKHYENGLFECFKKINDNLWRRIEDGTLTKDGLKKIRWNLVFDAFGIKGIDGPEFEEVFHDFLAVSAEPVSGAHELLTYLCGKYKLFATSNGPFKQQDFRLEKADMKKYFSGLFISEAVGAMKPSKEYFDYCIENANARKDEIVLIGDSLTADIAGGRNAGIKTVWFNHDRTDVPENKIWDYYVESLDEIKNIL